MFAHLSAFSACVGIPFGNIVGPLIMFLIRKDEYPLEEIRPRKPLTLISLALCMV